MPQSILDLSSYILCTGAPLSTSEYWMESHGKKIEMLSNVSGYIRKENGTIIESVTHYKPLPDGSRAWLHIYHDDELGMQRKQTFMNHYSKCFDELQRGEPVKEHKDF